MIRQETDVPDGDSAGFSTEILPGQGGWLTGVWPRLSCRARAGLGPVIQMIPVGETGLHLVKAAGAEGATAPETLRQMDRRGMKLWKEGRRRMRRTAPKGQAALA